MPRRSLRGVEVDDWHVKGSSARVVVAGAAVVLDDIARPGDREGLAGWGVSTDMRSARDERACPPGAAPPPTPAPTLSRGHRRPRRDAPPIARRPPTPPDRK